MGMNDTEPIVGPKMLKLVPRSNVVDNYRLVAREIRCFLNDLIKKPKMIGFLVEIVA